MYEREKYKYASGAKTFRSLRVNITTVNIDFVLCNMCILDHQNI